MMQNTDISHKEEGNVGPEAGNFGNLLENDRNENKNDVTPSQESFLRREPIVLTFVLCLSVIHGITVALQSSRITVLPSELMTLWSIIASVVPVGGLMFAAFLSDVKGRKPVYIYLFALSVLSSILQVSSNHTNVLFLSFLVQGAINGGTSVMGPVAISEYSCPKHRFAWMTAHVATWHTSRFMPYLIPWDNTEAVNKGLIITQIVLGLMCLGSTWFWPESPYWLASKGKLEQSRKAFLFLRGEESREELSSVLKARRRPGPPKLFWASLGIAIAAVSVTLFSKLHLLNSYRFYLGHGNFEWQFIIILISGIVIFSIIAGSSYLIKRKILFVIVSVISFTLSYVLAFCIWMYQDKVSNGSIQFLFYVVYIVSDVISRCGFLTVGVIMFIEIVPYKYNTAISCICFMLLYLFSIFLVPLHIRLEHLWSIHPAVLYAVYTTFALVGALIYYFFAPETKDKTLLEIQRLYTPYEKDSNTEQNLSMI